MRPLRTARQSASVTRMISPIVAGLVIIVTIITVTAVSTDLTFDQLLQPGSTGSTVKTLQARLNAWNVQPQLAPDGVFSPAVKAAVEDFQVAEGLTVTGIADPATWADLLKTPPASPSAITVSGAVNSALGALLGDGTLTAATPGYYQPSSQALVAAASGADNWRFYKLGELLVQDGFSDTIINLSREMNATWYQWSEMRAPPSEADAFILAWRQVVTTMRSVPGGHFKFLWTIYPTEAAVVDCWPGGAYVDYVGTDIFDWYGGPGATYPHTASGALDWALHWHNTLTNTPGGLNWIARFAKLTGKRIMIPEWGLDFHTFGGQDDVYFIHQMTAWLKAHNAIGLYWEGGHVLPAYWPGGPLLANEGASAQGNTPDTVNGLGALLGGHLQYAAVYLDDHAAISDAAAQQVLAQWVNAGYQLVLSADIIPNPPAIKSYSGPPEPGHHPFLLSGYPDAVAALRQWSG